MIPIRVAQRGRGILREFNEAGVLSAGVVHVAARLARLAGEDREPVLFAAALAVRAVRSGSVCLDLTRMRDIGVDTDDEHPDQLDLTELPWPDEETVIAAVRDSPLVCGGPAGPLRPLRLTEPARPGAGPLLYLDRYYRQEQIIRRVLTARASGHPAADPAVVCRELDRLFGPAGDTPDRQRLAAALAATAWTTVVAGGPGTGETHTIARILALLVAHRAAEPGGAPLRIALAAPTGKAAARLQEAVRDQAGPLGLPELSAATLHRLLGWQRGRTTRFRYHEHNRLPYDVVVVDETSMVSLTMMSRLLNALRPDTRLVLAGDPDQLASVDAGAVLADLVAAPFLGAPDPAFETILAADPGFAGASAQAGTSEVAEALTESERKRLRGGIVRLTRGRRFGGRIADLAVAVRAGDTDAALELLRSGGDTLELRGPEDIAAVRADIVTTSQRVTPAGVTGDAATALSAFESHRLLCAHRRGPYGVEHWDRTAAEWAASPEHRTGTWYPGQPLLVTANDHEARIYNGDTGVVVSRPDGSLRVALQRGEEPLLIHPTRFPAVVTVFAMTIHRSQGSQYDAVTIVLPEPGSSLLTRELLYTAITRARRHVRILGTEEAIRAAIDRHVLRASGLSLDQTDQFS